MELIFGHFQIQNVLLCTVHIFLIFEYRPIARRFEGCNFRNMCLEMFDTLRDVLKTCFTFYSYLQNNYKVE